MPIVEIKVIGNFTQTLYAMLKKANAQIAHLVFANTQSQP
jgi:hypothetical protein